MSSGPEAPGRGPASGRPFVSVVVTAYRRRQYLVEAVRSVVATSLAPSEYEVVVVKDFSDPAVDSELSRLGPNVHLITIDLPRMGDSLARGVEAARGEVVAFLEDDDRFLPGKLEAVAARFHADANLGFLRNAYHAIDAEGRPVGTWENFRPTPPAVRTFDPRVERPGDLPWVFRFSPNVNVSTMAVRAELLRPWTESLTRVTAALDSFLFVTALVSDRSVRVEPGTVERVPRAREPEPLRDRGRSGGAGPSGHGPLPADRGADGGDRGATSGPPSRRAFHEGVPAGGRGQHLPPRPPGPVVVPGLARVPPVGARAAPEVPLRSGVLLSLPVARPRGGGRVVPATPNPDPPGRCGRVPALSAVLPSSP